MKNFTVNEILHVMQKKGYRVFERDDKDYNLNLIGIRAATPVPNRFDDRLFVIWKYRGNWNERVYPITTDPGAYWLKNPMRVEGTAILKEGQYPGMWQIGLHRGQYEALVQVGPCTVIRDANRDNQLDFGGIEETGFFGINCHRATAYGTSKQVDKWSAGCQVFADVGEFNIFMVIAKESAGIWGNRFSYTLLNERGFQEVRG